MPIMNEFLKRTGQTIGLSSIAVSSYYNPLLPLHLSSIDLITKNFATPLTTKFFGKEYGTWIRNIFDPTNSLLVTLVKPGVITILNDIPFLQPLKGLFLDRGAAMMVSAGYYRDISALSNKPIIKELIEEPQFFLKSNALFATATNSNYNLDNGGSAFVKYSTIYACRNLISDNGFSERNNMCASAGEGATLSTRLYLTKTPLPLLVTATMIITKIASEWTVYKAADAARTEARYLMEKNPFITALNFKTALITFASEWTYTTITNFGRWVHKPIIETINKIITSEFSPTTNQVNDDITLPSQDETLLYEEQTAIEPGHTQQAICFWSEENITSYGHSELATNH